MCRLCNQAENSVKTSEWAKMAADLWKKLGNNEAALKLAVFF